MTRRRSSLPDPPDDLSRFPVRAVATTTPLWRVHSAHHDARWFCHDLECRFDLPDPNGTLYCAERPVGCLAEVFQGFTLVDEGAVRNRLLSRLRVPRRLRVADCTSARARGFGCTGEIHAGSDYDRTQRWARAFHAAGFDGIRYTLRSDPSLRLTGVAVFGPAGGFGGWVKPRPLPIPADVLREAQTRFGLRILPLP